MNISLQECTKVLKLGLRKYENYIHQQVDELWDISITRNIKKFTYLGEYQKATKRIWIYNHERTIHEIDNGRILNTQLCHYDMEDTVLHELAHHIVAVCYPVENRNQTSHGPRWKWVCTILGCNPHASQSANFDYN